MGPHFVGTIYSTAAVNGLMSRSKLCYCTVVNFVPKSDK